MEVLQAVEGVVSEEAVQAARFNKEFVMKTTGFVFVGLVIVLALYLALGGCSLAQQRVGIDAAKGEVWNQVDAGAQKIRLLESQVLGAYNQQLQVVNAIVEGRKAMEAARASGDIDAATEAAQKALVNINALAEANPVQPLTELQRGLLDESAGVLNRIAYARGKLIDTQRVYNQSRIMFFPIAGFFPAEEILGSTANPAQPLPTSIFAPTPAR